MHETATCTHCDGTGTCKEWLYRQNPDSTCTYYPCELCQPGLIGPIIDKTMLADPRMRGGAPCAMCNGTGREEIASEVDPAR